MARIFRYALSVYLGLLIAGAVAPQREADEAAHAAPPPLKQPVPASQR